MSHTILVVEEDDAIRTFLADQLTTDECAIYETGDLDRAFALCATRRPDAAIIDVNGGSGRAFAARVRGGTDRGVDARLPLILLGTAPGDLDAVRSFEAGADDYVVKPFSYPELRARLRAVLARVERYSRRASVICVGDLRIDLPHRRVTHAGTEVPVGNKELALLRALAVEPTRVHTKQELLREIWGMRAVGSTRTLDSHACRLRSKLAAAGTRMVTNVWDVGNRLIDAPFADVPRAPLAHAS